MQTLTGTLTTALAGDESTVAVRVLVDWNRNGSYADTYDDLSLYVDEQSVERAISSDIPDAAQVLSGRSDGSAELTLTGPEVVAIFSPYTTTLSSVARMGAPCQIDLAVTTAAGIEYVPLLRGRITRVTLDADAGTVGLQVVDQWESVTKSLSVPMVVADDKALVRSGLNASWVMDWVLRQNGFYCTPAVRSSCVLSATFHGSAAAEVGTLTKANLSFVSGSDAGKPASGLAYESGFMGPQAATIVFGASNLSSQLSYNASTVLSVDAGANLFVEGFVKYRGLDVDLVRWSATGTNGLTSSLTLGLRAGALYASLSRSGSAAVTTTFGAASNGNHYIAIHAAFTATGVTLNGRVDATSSSSSLTPVTGGAGEGAATGNGYSAGIVLGGINFGLEGYQITTEAYSASMWNNGFTRTAVLEPSLNELTATPSLDTTDSRDLLQAIAAAEAGIVTFDETGVFRFYNRNHLPQTTLSATLTATRDLLSIGTTEALDSVRNVVAVPARPLKVETTDSTVWALSETTVIPARGGLVITAEFENPVFLLRTSVAYYTAIPYATGSGYKLTSGSGYRASTSADGTGTNVKNLTVAVTQTGPTSATIAIRNPNAFAAYLVNNNDQDPSDEVTQGSDFLILRGRAVVPATTSTSGDGTITAVVRNDASIAVFREQSLDVSDSPWMQSSTSANDLASHLAFLLGVPRPVMDTVGVIANPALQLADRVHLTDAETGSMLDRDYGIAGYSLNVSDEGLTQTVDVRELLIPLVWDGSGVAGTWDYASWQ